MSKPNIIYIMADDMGYGDLGCYGATKIPTPHMDRIAAEGVRMTDAHSSSAVCTPSRYAVLTGRYAWRGGLERWVLGGYGTPLIEPERPTVASLLKQAGYRTAAVGKWHVGLNWQRTDGSTEPIVDFGNPAWSLDGFDIDHSKPIGNGPTELGFDSYFGIAGSLDMPPYCFIEDDHTVGIPDREKEIYYNQQRKGMQTPDWQDDQVDVTFAAKAVEVIESAEDDEAPFFLYLTPASPHRPSDVSPDFVVGASEAGDRGDMVVLFDWVVGQVLDALDRTGQSENTLILVTSDNGGRLTCADGETYGHPTNGSLRGQKADIWDGGHREPLVARWPGHIPAGSVNGDLVCLSDLLATCAAVADVDVPEEAGEDSFNMLPTLTGQSLIQPIRHSVIHHSGDGIFSIRYDDWKMVLGLGSGGFSEPVSVEPEPGGPIGQLYNMQTDPSEQQNLWNERPDIVVELGAMLERQRREGRTRQVR